MLFRSPFVLEKMSLRRKCKNEVCQIVDAGHFMAKGGLKNAVRVSSCTWQLMLDDGKVKARTVLT